MRQLRGFLVVLVVLLGLSSAADAQTCTLGPYTQSTPLAAIDAAIDAADDAAVVCLRRGSRWTQDGGAALSFATGHPNAARVTICASDDTRCTDGSGGANPRITMSSGQCFDFEPTGDGYTIQDVDCYGTNTCDPKYGAAGWWDPGIRDVTVQGGVFDGWGFMSVFYANASVPPATNVRFGTCAKPIEFRNCYAHLRYVHYGHCRQCGFSYRIHDWGDSVPENGRGHVFDFAGWDSTNDIESRDVTVECTHWQVDTTRAPGNGDAIRVSDGANIVIRDNVFEKVAGSCEPSFPGAVGFASHGDVSGWDGGEIYRNRIKLGNCFNGVNSGVGRNLQIYNNVFDMRNDDGGPNYWGAAISVYDAGGAAAWAPDNVWVYNNTIYSPDGSDDAQVHFDAGNGHRFFNNLLINGEASTARVFATNSCNRFGANGAEIRSNVVYTPSDATPDITSCQASSSWMPAAPWQTSPGLVDVGAGAFELVGPGSYVAGRGTTAGAPGSDFRGAARPSPPSVGAFDLGETPPPAPPPAGPLLPMPPILLP